MYTQFCLITAFYARTEAFNLPCSSQPKNRRVRQGPINIPKRTNYVYNDERTWSPFGKPRIRHSSLAMTAGQSSDNDDDNGKEKGLEKDITKHLKQEETKKPNNGDNKPPNKGISSDRFSSKKKGSQSKMQKKTSQPKGEGEQYTSILSPPPTTANEKFPDRRKDANANENGGRGGRRKSIRTPGRGNFVSPKMGDRKFKPKKGESFRSSQDRKEDKKDNKKSLLPPKEDSSGLTSWDDFFSTNLQKTGDNRKGDADGKSKVENGKKGMRGNKDFVDKSADGKIDGLPSTPYLFGKGTIDSIGSGTSKDSIKNDTKGKVTGSLLPSLDGVLPVSELFYRSTQSITAQDDAGDSDNDVSQPNAVPNEKSYSDGEKETDDDELPFSTEQSDRIQTRKNKIFIRKNKAKASGDGPIDDGAQYKTDLAKLRTTVFPPPRTSNQSAGKKNRRKRGVTGNGRFQQRNTGQGRGRKMIRRGMEMLVGGEPINADPPLRFVELNYCLKTADALSERLLLLKDEDTEKTVSLDNDSVGDWASVVTTNSRDFGPMLHKSSVDKLSDTSRQLYCEHFIKSSIKWNICPKDLKAIVKQHEKQKSSESAQTYKDLIDTVSSVKFVDPKSVEMKLEENLVDMETKGFGKEVKKSRKRNINSTVDFNAQRSASDSENLNRAARRSNAKQDTFTLDGELKFSLGVTRAELESGHDGGSHGHILRRVLSKGIGNAIKAELLGFKIVIAKMLLSEVDEGSTELHIQFNMIPDDSMKYGDVERATKKINLALSQAMNDGDMALAMGAAAKSETSWTAKVRNRVVEEFLFDAEDEDSDQLCDEDDSSNDDDDCPDDAECVLDDEDDFEAQREDEDIPLSNVKNQKIKEEFDGPFGMPGDTIYAKDDIFLGGGNGGVFPDYSENSKSLAPYSGELGPLLLDAVTQRALERQPRVIAIGDVHGCIDELQALLRRCDYRPGDLIVFLGDMVSKGPDSLACVQMARELGALGVRGNHDFEVIRWHQAIKSGKNKMVLNVKNRHCMILTKILLLAFNRCRPPSYRIRALPNSIES